MSFLEQFHLPKIDDDMLNFPLSLEELKLTLDSMPKNTALGSALILETWDGKHPVILTAIKFENKNIW